MKAFSTARTLLAMAWRMDRVKLVKAILLLGGGFAATPLIALGLRELTDALLGGQNTRATLFGVVLAALVTLELMGQSFAYISYFELGELTQADLQQRLFTAANSHVPLARQEQPDYRDELQIAQSQAWNMGRAMEATLQFGGVIVQLVLSAVLLAQLNAVLLFVPCLAVFLILSTSRAQRLTDQSQKAAAEPTRRSRHLLQLATAPESLLEMRLLGLQQELVDRHTAAWDSATDKLWQGQVRAALAKSIGQFAFAIGYAGTLLLVFRQLAAGQATVGDFVMVLAIAVQTTTQVAAAVALLAVLQQTGVTLARIDKLAQVPPEPVVRQRTPAATPAEDGIVLRNVSFAYPGGGDRPVLADINLVLPPGAVVAVVGENGAGKSTLIKLLCGLYRPTEGRIWLNGREVTTAGSADAPIAALFQDFARIELAIRDSVGVGACDGAEPARDEAVWAALHRADTADLARELPDGLDSVIGSHFAKGTELSGGQWQRIGLARALVRERPALLILDEPAAALDPMAEHALFERFAVAARTQETDDKVTVYVSHRFSTVRMADMIIVLDGRRVAACGTHEELMRAGGTYHELYTLQARAYADG